MENNKLSIITISYNAEAVIEETLCSVLQQTYRPLEYIMVDGLSQDRTMEIIKRYVPEFQLQGIQVKTISEKDNGISDAFNKGIQVCTGDVVGIINAGDRYTADACATAMEAMAKDTMVLCGNILWVDKTNGLTYERRSSHDWRQLKKKMSIMHPSCFVKKEAYLRWGLFDTKLRYAMDYDLLARFWRGGAAFQYLDCVLAVMPAEGVSDSGDSALDRELLLIYKKNGSSPLGSKVRLMCQKIRGRMIKLLKQSKCLWHLLRR